MRGRAVAELVVPASAATVGCPAYASGGGYEGPLACRMGEPMRPDVALAFDAMAQAARRDGIALAVNSGFRSDAEQAELFAANPNPRWVAPPGTSLHRYGTELDLGPPAAYAWLAANARRFGFIHRYAWEPWHYGYGENPRDRAHPAQYERGSWEPPGGDHGRVRHGLPSFVPASLPRPDRQGRAALERADEPARRPALRRERLQPVRASAAPARRASHSSCRGRRGHTASPTPSTRRRPSTPRPT